jgi:hypothetical protein
MNIHQAAQSGDEVATLEAMRDSLAAAMDMAEPAVIAQVAGRLEAVLKRITELRPARKETLDDVLAQRRAAKHPTRATGTT